MRKILSSVVAAACLLLVVPGAASASFHLMQVREVYAGSAQNAAADYVELQMWASGQNEVAGHFLRTYDASGNVTGTVNFANDVTNGASQSTLLLATAEADAVFGVTADASLGSADLLSPTGGAVCWEGIDCVSWGNFTGSSLPSPAGTPVAATGIPDGMAIRRSISRGCATALDPEDDHDDSTADFAPVFPAPRPNSVSPTEQLCSSGGTGGGGGGPAGGGAPDTALLRKPPKRTGDRTPTFRFKADEANVHFQCKLDGKPFRACRSPFTTKRLTLGAHSFRVRAVDSQGKADPTPAVWRFRVVRG